jgi:hypothetical protein
MSNTNIATQIQLLKNDLSETLFLSYAERSNHLKTNSRPLLRSLFQLLQQETEALSVSQTTQLCDLLVDYLGFDHYIAIESSMCLYRLKSIKSDLNDLLEEKIDNLLELRSSKADDYKIIKIISQLFTFDVVLSSEIFNKKASFINLITNEVTLLSNEFNTINGESIKNLNILLNLFSNACVDEPSRSLIASMNFNIILKCLSSSAEELEQSKCYATTITIKLWRLIKSETLENNSSLLCLKNLLNIILASLSKNLESSVEGLSLLCTNIQIKQQIRTKHILDTLFILIKNKEHTRYGIISILSALTLPNRVTKLRQRSITTLKDANSIDCFDIDTNEKINVSKLTDDENQIQFVIEELIKRNFVSNYLMSIFKSLETSKGLIGECIKLMHNIIFPDVEKQKLEYSDNQSYKIEFIKESKQIVKLLTAYLIGTSQNIKYNHDSFIRFVINPGEIPEQDLEYRSIAIKALTSPKISININQIYGKDNEEFALSPVPFILEILIQHDIDLGTSSTPKETPFTSLKKQVFSSFDVYYALISLGALASLGYKRVKETIFTFGFDSIISLLSSNDQNIQFSALQLLHQISDLPLCMARLYNWETESDIYYQNFASICYLMLSENTDLQNLSLSLFYSSAVFDIIAVKLATNQLFCDNLSKIFEIADVEPELLYTAILVLSRILPFKNNVPNNQLHLFDKFQSLITKLSKEDGDLGECATQLLKYM